MALLPDATHCCDWFGKDGLAINELRYALRLFPREKSLSYLSSQIYAAQKDYDSAFRILRRAFPDYDSQAIENLPDRIWQLLYPFERWERVYSQSAVYGIDPAFVMGLIRQESAFNEKARSAIEQPIESDRGIQNQRSAAGNCQAVREEKILSGHKIIRTGHGQNNFHAGSTALW